MMIMLFMIFDDDDDDDDDNGDDDLCVADWCQLLSGRLLLPSMDKGTTRACCCF